MRECVKLEDWRAATRQEMLRVLQRDRSEDKPSALTIRTYLRPVDTYAYLKARFGRPNGFQEYLRRDDSDNLVHWDYALMAGSTTLFVSGHGRSVQVIVHEPISDEDWKTLVLAIKNDFGRVKSEKTRTMKSFEKYVKSPLESRRFASCANLALS
jgi:hypothetical protein